ncbi:MAG: hypothetical protein U1A78_36940 [Polyangia bacterium]
MPSKQVVDRQKEAQAVLAAGTTHATEIVKGLTGLLQPELGRGEKLPDLSLLLQLMTRTLATAEQEMVAADEAYQHELLDDAAPRQARDDAAEALRQRLIDLRDTLRGLYGEPLVQAAGFTSQTPLDPMLLSRFAGQISEALRKVTLPKPRLPGLKLNAAELSTELDDLRAALDRALGDVARETREAQAAASERQARQDRFDERYAGIANLLIGLLRLCGKPDLAARVRLSWRRSPSEPADPADPAPTPAPTPTP